MNKELSVWITEEDFGTVRTLSFGGRTIQYRIPKEIDGQITLRFKGYGRTRNGENGDVLLIVRVDRGRDIEADVWLSEAQALSGWVKILHCNKQRISVSIPPGSKHLQTLRVPHVGKRLSYRWGLPLFGRKRGAAIITLKVFSEKIVPLYRQSDHLSTEALSLEGWIYRRYDELLKQTGGFPHKLPPFPLQEAADAFNQNGWRGIADKLSRRLNLRSSSVKFRTSSRMELPGQCKIEITKGTFSQTERYTITIRTEFTNDPFTVTAILAHELCHILEYRMFGRNRQRGSSELMEIERTVDLLVFLFQLGDFQMRVARDRKISFGYFNQELFERMYVILSRKRDSYVKTGRQG